MIQHGPTTWKACTDHYMGPMYLIQKGFTTGMALFLGLWPLGGGRPEVKPMLLLSILHQLSILNSTKFYQMMENGIGDIHKACDTIPKPYQAQTNDLEGWLSSHHTKNTA